MIRSLPQFRASLLFLIASVLGILLPAFCAAQQPAPPPPPPAAGSATTSPQAATPDGSRKQQSKALPFLILGTVFTEKDYAFPGVQVRIRRKGEKKFRFGTYTNSRGEFAIRVPDGIEYEVVVAQKKYKEQVQVVSANRQEVQKRLTIKMEVAAPAK